MKLFRIGTLGNQGSYDQIEVSEMILRDHLATARTNLSNQNTFLAYIRTALTLFVSGTTFVQFFDVASIQVIGLVFVPLGVATFFVGLYRYNRLRVVLEKLQPY